MTNVQALVCLAVLAFTAAAAAQTSELPEAPSAVIANACRCHNTKTFSLNGILQEKLTVPSNTLVFAFGVGVQYRLPRNRVQLGMTYIYTPSTSSGSITGSVNTKLLQWGSSR